MMYGTSENCIGFMVILGKDEWLKFEKNLEGYSRQTLLTIARCLLLQIQ